MTEIQNDVTFTRSDFGSLTPDALFFLVVSLLCSEFNAFVLRVNVKSAASIIFFVCMFCTHSIVNGMGKKQRLLFY